MCSYVAYYLKKKEREREFYSVQNILGMWLVPDEETEKKAEVIRALREEWRISSINTS